VLNGRRQKDITGALNRVALRLAGWGLWVGVRALAHGAPPKAITDTDPTPNAKRLPIGSMWWHTIFIMYHNGGLHG
jgi:hypothetical protein